MTTAYEKCQLIYSEMARSCDDAWLWQGYVSDVFEVLGISLNQYSQLMGLLRHMGCIERLRKGGGNTESIWRVIAPPTEDIYEAAKKTYHDKDVPNLNERLTKLEEDIRRIKNDVDSR